MEKTQVDKQKSERALEEDAQWAIERAGNYVNQGKLDRALLLLGEASKLSPNAKGLSELLTVTQVCMAASWSPCSYCSSKPHRPKHPDWYQILKVDETADTDAIKRRYRQLALLLHPDKNKHAKAEEAFKLVSEAYAYLSDKNKRSHFNFERSKLQCKQCTILNQPQTVKHSLYDPSSEILKRKNSDISDRQYKGTDHVDEWRLEKEKLRLFRERAKEGVDSLAKILQENEPQSNKEFSNLKERCQSERMDRKTISMRFEHNQLTNGRDSLQRVWHEKPSVSDTRQQGLGFDQFEEFGERFDSQCGYGNKNCGKSKSKVYLESRLQSLATTGNKEEALFQATHSANKDKLLSDYDMHVINNFLDDLECLSNNDSDEESKQVCYSPNFSPSSAEENASLLFQDKSPRHHRRMQIRDNGSSPKMANVTFKPLMSSEHGIQKGRRKQESVVWKEKANDKSSFFAEERKFSNFDGLAKFSDGANPLLNCQLQNNSYDNGGGQSNKRIGGLSQSRNGVQADQITMQYQRKNSDQILDTLECLRQETKFVAATLDNLKKGTNHENIPTSSFFFPQSCRSKTSMVS